MSQEGGCHALCRSPGAQADKISTLTARRRAAPGAPPFSSSSTRAKDLLSGHDEPGYKVDASQAEPPTAHSFYRTPSE